MNGRVRYLGSGVGIGLRVIVIAAVAVGAGWIGQALWGVSVWVLIWQNRYFWYSVLLGALTGAAEVIARYRDEPFAATFSLPGVSYLIMNGALSGTAY